MNEGLLPLLTNILDSAARAKATEIHVSPRSKESWVRFRQHGHLYTALTLPSNDHEALVETICEQAAIPSHRGCLGFGSFSQRNTERSIHYRVHSVPCWAGTYVLLTPCRETEGALDLDELGMEPKVLQQWRRLAVRPGALIVTGPYDGGKTTTVFATLAELNDSQRNIVTGEYCYERRVNGINQSLADWSAGRATKPTFADRFKAHRRDDADVLLGKFDDIPDALAGLEAAAAGRTVFGSLHLRHSVQVLRFFIDNGIERWLVADAVSVVLARQFIPRLCTCAESYRPSHHVLEQLAITKDSLERMELSLAMNEIRFKRPRGCARCRPQSGNPIHGRRHGTNRLPGYRGDLTGIFECLVFDDELRQAIKNCVPMANVATIARSQGMLSLRESALRKALIGETSLEQVMIATAQRSSQAARRL